MSQDSSMDRWSIVKRSSIHRQGSSLSRFQLPWVSSSSAMVRKLLKLSGHFEFVSRYIHIYIYIYIYITVKFYHYVFIYFTFSEDLQWRTKMVVLVHEISDGFLGYIPFHFRQVQPWFYAFVSKVVNLASNFVFERPLWRTMINDKSWFY